MKSPKKINKRIEVLLKGFLGASRSAATISFHVKEIPSNLTPQTKLKKQRTVAINEIVYKIIYFL